MNQNTFGKTKAANDLVKILEDNAVAHKTIKKIGKKLTNYNRGLNAILTIEDEKVKVKLLELWKKMSLKEIDDFPTTQNIINHIKNIELAYFKRKTYNNTAA